VINHKRSENQQQQDRNNQNRPTDGLTGGLLLDLGERFARQMKRMIFLNDLNVTTIY